MWINKPFFKYITAIILTLLTIFLFGKIDYFIWPFQKLVITIFFPILISGLLYYILRPVVRLLAHYIPLSISILLVFAAITGIGYTALKITGPIIVEQGNTMIERAPETINSLANKLNQLLNKAEPALLSTEKLKDSALKYAEDFPKIISKNAGTIISVITSTATTIVIVPFIVFYFLRDGHKLRPYLLKFIPNNVEAEGSRILVDVDKTLSAYIVGQFIIALSDGILMYFGYLFIGLENALLLAIFVTLLSVVPFLGPFLGIVPALIAAFLTSPMTVIKVLILMVIVQQIEGNLITPQVMGKKLNIHPLTVIFLLLIAGSIYGFIGILIAIPVYSVVKVIVKNFYKFYNLRTGS